MKNGVPILCTGCGSDEHFYQECQDLNKEKYRPNIARMKYGKSKSTKLRSYFLQMGEEATGDSQEYECTSHEEEEKGESRAIANALDGRFDAGMFIESVVDDDSRLHEM